MVEGLGIKTTGRNFLHDVSRLIKELPELRGRSGTTRKMAAAAHYRYRFA